MPYTVYTFSQFKIIISSLNLFIYEALLYHTIYCIFNYPCNQYLSPLPLWVKIPFMRGVLDITFWDKVCQWLAAGWWFSLSTPVSSTNKTDCHDIAKILLKVVLNTLSQPYCIFKSSTHEFDHQFKPWIILNYKVHFIIHLYISSFKSTKIISSSKKKKKNRIIGWHFLF